MPSIFRISYQEKNDRLDPIFHKPEFALIEKKLKSSKLPIYPLHEIADITCGSTPKDGSSLEQDTDSILFLKTLNIRDYTLDLEKVYYISKTSHESRVTSQLVENDVLLNIIGANLDVVGRLAMIPKEFPEANINQNIARIRIIETEVKEKEMPNIRPFYLMSYLGLDIAQLQIEKISRQAGQVNLNTQEVGLIEVPIPSPEIQQKICDIISSAVESRKSLLERKERLKVDFEHTLYKALGINFNNFTDLRCFTISHSHRQDRLDSEFYRPRYQKLQLALINQGRKLSDLVTFSSERVNPTDKVSETFRYVQIQDLDEETGLITSCSVIQGKDAPSRARMLLKSGDIIIPSLMGTFKKVSIVTEEYDGTVGTTGFIIIHPKGVNPDYLLSILRSDIGQWQMERWITGAIMPAITPNTAKNIIIPIKPSIEKRIISLTKSTRESIHNIRRKANLVVVDAKSSAEETLFEVV